MHTWNPFLLSCAPTALRQAGSCFEVGGNTDLYILPQTPYKVRNAHTVSQTEYLPDLVREFQIIPTRQLEWTQIKSPRPSLCPSRVRFQLSQIAAGVSVWKVVCVQVHVCVCGGQRISSGAGHFVFSDRSSRWPEAFQID